VKEELMPKKRRSHLADEVAGFFNAMTRERGAMRRRPPRSGAEKNPENPDLFDRRRRK
jgi:hypothetical protein